MTHRLKRVAPFQAGKIFAVLYGCMGLIFLPFFALFAMLGAFAQHAHTSQAAPAVAIGGMLIGMGIAMPIMYAVMGFIIGLLGAALYNLIAGWVGGLEFEIE